MAEKWVEDTTITLPTIKDGVKGIGDLWSCHESKVLGFNLFEHPLKREHLIEHRLGTHEYSLVHIKSTKDLIKNIKLEGSIKIELLGGLIPVEASAGFEKNKTKNANEEQLICKYNTETYTVQLIPTKGKNAIDNQVSDQIISGRIKATHVVTGVILGGEVNAQINIKQIKTDTLLDIKGDIVGNFKYGPINGTVKASLKYLDDDKSCNYEKHITINSKPSIRAQPTTIEDMFNVVESIENIISNEKHFKMISIEIFGVPIRYILVPITQFVDVKIEKLYLQLKHDIEDDLSSMLTLLHDYRMTGFVTNMVIDKMLRLRFIISDNRSQLSKDIVEYETKLKQNAEIFFNRSYNAIKEYKIKLCEAKDLKEFVDDFAKSGYNYVDVDNKIESFINQGKEELIGIHDKDAIDMNADIIRFTNEIELKEWFRTETKIKLLLYTKGNSPDGVFKRLFKMTSALKEINIETGVALPSISAEFSLMIKVGSSTKSFKSDEILFVLGIICAIIGYDLGTESYFHVLNAQLFDKSLPLKNEKINDLFNLILMLNMNKSVNFTESLAHSIQKIREENTKWKFFLCLDAIDTAIIAVENFKYYMNKWSKELDLDCEWIAGTFEINGNDMNASPLLFVFYESNLEAICCDNIDYLILDRHFHSTEFKSNPKPNKILSPELSIINTYFPDQAKFAIKVVNLLSHTQNPKLKSYDFQMTSFSIKFDRDINNALEIARYTVGSSKDNVIGVLAFECMTTFSNLQITFTSHGFSKVKKQFNNLNPDKLYKDLEKWLNIRDPFNANIYSAILAINTRKNREENDSIDKLINTIISDKACEPTLVIAINEWLSSEFRYDQIGNILKEYSQNSEFEKRYTMIIALLTLLKQMINSKCQANIDVYEILPQYIDRIISSLNPQSLFYKSFAKFDEYLSERKSYHLISLLAKYKYDGNLRELQLLLLDNITDLDSSDEFTKFIELLYSSKLEEKNFIDLWKNLNFQHLIGIGIENREVMDCVIHAIQNSTFDIIKYLSPMLSNLKSELEKRPKRSENKTSSVNQESITLRDLENSKENNKEIKFPPILFHSIHGTNIRLSSDFRVAKRTESFGNGIVFSNRPILVNERVYIKFAEISTEWSGEIRFGFTVNDPSSYRFGLPKFAIPDLTNKEGNWAKAIKEGLAVLDSTLFYYVTNLGDVYYGINGQEIGIFFSGVNVNCSLWALIDIYGNTTAIESIDPKSK